MKILVVDDDVVSRMVLMHMIDECSQFGGQFEIAEAEDGADAWAQIEAGLQPALLFCDLRMPRLSGMQLLALVRGQGVLVSSANDRETVGQAMGLGATGFVVKPFEAPQVRAHLAPFLTLRPLADDAEDPLATMGRLGINSERLMVYLGGLQAQVGSAGAEIVTLIGRARHTEARQRIERLEAGCLTLGLISAAGVLRDLPAGPLQAGQVQAALADAVRAAMHQSEAVKRLHAPA